MRSNAYSSEGKWRLIYLPEVESWMTTLNEDELDHLLAALDHLSEHGPKLGRPYVDLLKGSKLHNLKELRPLGGNLRLLFIFDPSRNAVILVGGDKSERWKSWYFENIQIAEVRYERYLNDYS